MNSTIPANRRGFMSHVGRGMLAAGLGTSLANDLGFSTAFADEGPEMIHLGDHERLVELMRSTSAENLQPVLAKKVLKGEVDLKQLVAAGALANAVTFGGCDYVGFHTAMAMLPALEMSRQLPRGREPLPVLKVLYRNSQQIQNVGGRFKVEMHTLDATKTVEHVTGSDLGQQIRGACRKSDEALGESLLATADGSLEAFNALQPAVQDDVNVHRFVFAHRLYGLAELLGKEFSFSLLRQCVRFCAMDELNIRKHRPEMPIRRLVPKLLDQYKLAAKELGNRDPGDAEIEKLSQAIYRGPSEQSAEVVAAALAEGIDPEFVGEAISLASNQLLLRQGTKGWLWKAHGDSPGVHSSDATNAWRNMARTADRRYAVSGLIVAAYSARQMSPFGKSDSFESPGYPTDEHRDLVKLTAAKELLAEAEDAIHQNDQGRATAAIQIYGEHGYSAEPVFKLMLKYAVSEDGRLHAEKYYHTVREEYETIRPAFRWRQLVGLARVTASAFGYNREDQNGFRAAGYEEACRLLNVEG
jgi:hypothetical protein